MAYDRSQPIGRERDDYLAAMNCYLLASINSKKNANIKLEDFMPSWDGSKNAPKTSEEIEKTLTSFAKSHNHRLKVKKVRSR